MSLKATFAIFTILYSVLSMGQGAAPNIDSILDHEETGGRGKLRTSDTSETQETEQSSMEKISEKFPKVKEAYLKCSDVTAREPSEKHEDCIWREIGDLQEKVIAYLDEEKEAREENPSLKTGEQGNFRTTKDKTTRKLEEYLKERLSKILYDEDKEGPKALTNHGKFYDIYKSQIGQNIIRVASDICIYAEPSQKVDANGTKLFKENGDPDFSGTIPSNEAQRKINKDKNIANLSEVLNGQPKSYWVYSDCLASMSSQCKSGGYLKTCNVLKYMEEAKRGIKDIDGINKEIKELSNNAHIEGLSTSENNDESELAKATLISSGDIDKAKLAEESKSEEKILEKCLQDSSKKPSEECSQYLTDHDDKETIEAEFMIRQKAIEMRIRNKINEVDKNNEDEKIKVVTEILKEEGLDEEQIKLYLAKEGQVQGFNPLQDIEDRYEKQREAVIADLKNHNFDQTGLDPNDTDPNKSSFEGLKKTAATRSDDLKVSIHFFNVVGAFIDIKGEDGKSLKNTNALKNELQNSGFSETTADARFNDEHNKKLSDILSNTKDQADESDPPTLDTQNIDQIIYEIGENKPE